jgi:hypothetical protein
MPRQEGHHSTMRHSRLDSSGSTASSFDELAKGLAEGSISRRRALKLFAGCPCCANPFSGIRWWASAWF